MHQVVQRVPGCVGIKQSLGYHWLVQPLTLEEDFVPQGLAHVAEHDMNGLSARRMGGCLSGEVNASSSWNVVSQGRDGVCRHKASFH